MKYYVLGIILLVAVIATAVNLAQKPIEAPVQIDAQSPGVWPRYAGALIKPTASTWFAAYQVPQPPERLRGNVMVDQVYFTDQPTIDGICGGRDFYTACAIVGGGEMALPNPCQHRFAGESYAALACHELGHVNGWPASHRSPGHMTTAAARNAKGI